MSVAQFGLQIRFYNVDTQVLALEIHISTGQLCGVGHCSLQKCSKGVYYAAVG